jgi:hypothetical protein
MSKISKWSPLRIPGAFRQSTDQTEGSDDPMDSWDASDWDDPDSGGWKQRLKPNHTGQWLILGAVFTVFVGVVLWLGQFFPLTHQNPWTLVAVFWPASLAVTYVKGREDGFLANSRLDWTFITTGRSVRVLPGKFVSRFGQGDIQHIKFTPLKSRVYGAFRFNFLKLGDLEADREHLMSKASGTNRGPDSDARLLLPGPLTGENTSTVLGRVYGVHGGAVEYHDSGQETDMRVTNPSTLDDDIAADVLNQLELYDHRIIPELKAEINTVETQKNRYKQRAEAERDPELDRVFSAVDTISSLLQRDGRRRNGSDEDGDVEEINERARERVEGDS